MVFALSVALCTLRKPADNREEADAALINRLSINYSQGFFYYRE